MKTVEHMLAVFVTLVILCGIGKHMRNQEFGIEKQLNVGERIIARKESI
jgi:hypothetical protein